MEMVHFIPASQRRLALMAAQSESSQVLILGASGTGKGAISQWIHLNGPRASKPFLVASQDQPLADQIFEAQGGTISVPELGEWPLGEQKILLGYLKTKSIPHPEQGRLPMLAHARIIATTSQDLESRAQGGLFNSELLSKFDHLKIKMPPLSQRKEELEDIALGLLGEITREFQKEHLKDLTLSAWERLKQYDWPGNIRELRNVLKLAAGTAREDLIQTTDLPDFEYSRIDLRATREQFEKIYIIELLKSFDWQIDQTCTSAQMNKEEFLSKIKKYGIEEYFPQKI